MKRAFADIATTIDQLSGRPLTFGVALLIIAAWALSGPLFNFSDTWQLITGNSLAEAQQIFARSIMRRPPIRLTIKQRTRVLQQWPA
jgi:low affinity Fe/Cu permease